jgi:hypothetical protein
MINKIYILLLFLTTSFSYGQNLKLTNGNFFVDGKFVNYPVMYVRKGIFTFKKPSKIDTVINLENKYIIPPFAEGHTHKLDNPKELKKDIATFLSQGVFYVNVLNNFSSNVQTDRDELKANNDLEVSYANGGITATGQHPSFVYERILSNIKDWWLPVNTAKIRSSKKGENDAYWFMDSIKDVDDKWVSYLKTNPDLVKVYLMNAKNNDNQDPKSLSESAVKHIVEKAKKAGLRVVAHIETFDDLKIGLRCGISIYGHLPHYNVNFLKEIPTEIEFLESEKALIKTLNPIITPTLSFNEEFSMVRNEKNNYQGEMDTVSFNRSLTFQKRTIQKLTENGFRFAIGSDRDSFLPELSYWFKYNIFSKKNILTIATKTTPQLIFPNRKIGEIKAGYEGSFLVLNGNPFLNYENIKSILVKVKKGRIL